MRRSHILPPSHSALAVPSDLSLNVTVQEKAFEPSSKLGPTAPLQQAWELFVTFTYICVVLVAAQTNTRSWKARITVLCSVLLPTGQHSAWHIGAAQ